MLRWRRQPRSGSVVGLSEGQRTALAQLRRIADTDRSPVRMVGVEKTADLGGSLVVHITLDCTRHRQVESGLRLHDREGITLYIPREFPFHPPRALTAHTRFHGFGHVHWGRLLCLYVSPETQWDPSRGMFGFIAQLTEWLRRGARNELDHPEGPLHPPIAYTASSTSICVNADTPGRSHWPWFGAAVLTRTNPNLLEVHAWQPVHAVPDDVLFAPTVLLDFELPYEYPLTVRHLLQHLEIKGGPSRRVLVHLMLASERVSQGEPLHVGVGTPSRGLAGDLAHRRQHLTFWEIEPSDVTKLRDASVACDISNYYRDRETPQQIQGLIDTVWDTFFRWQSEAPVRWCHVLENRPEIISRRDEGTAMDWFRGKRVALWGCGAIGGLIAEHLARAGVAELTLYDQARVIPGIMVRQNYSAADINEPKVAALARRVKSIAPDVSVTTKIENIITRTLSRSEWDADVDVVIDTTASLLVRSKLEALLKDHEPRVPIVGVMLSASAQHAVAVIVPPGYRAGPFDVFRRVGLAAINRKWLSDWAKAFWTTDAVEGLRQPEPGCSDPTFVASHADVAVLSARALNAIAKSLAEDHVTASGFLFSQSSDHREHRFRFRPYIRWVAGGLDFRLSANAWRDITSWIRAGTRERSAEHETGGLLFGEFDETLGIAWITNVSGPPQDSKFSAEGFVCGTDGIKELCKDYRERTHRIVRYVGTWHSHPVSPARPSITDYVGIRTIFTTANEEGAHQLMLIVGHACEGQLQIGAYAFEKHHLSMHQVELYSAIKVRGGVTTPPPVAALDKTIGLALSGGGSRAVAFHLGTLRALEDLKLLDEVDVISGVSGGSVMTGMLGYNEAPFADIDRNAVKFLRDGLVWPALKKLACPSRALRLSWNLFVVALPTLLIDFLTWIVGKTASVLPSLDFVTKAITRFSWPLRSHYSGTHVIADSIADAVGTQNCDAPTRQGKSIVFNACELRTGTAFRMSNERFGTWRYGWAPANELRVADAVAASAAYPPILSPFDWTWSFELKGKTTQHRVIVTDGGVFENLGVSVMEPSRDSQISGISYNPDIIVASDAGVGQFAGDTKPLSWLNRMTQVMSVVMRKVQDATKKRLHDHSESGRLDGFVYASLGQIDRRVPLKPANWVDREEVLDYPTDFSAMSMEDIRRLSGRGEAITRALVTQYLLSD